MIEPTMMNPSEVDMDAAGGSACARWRNQCMQVMVTWNNQTRAARILGMHTTSLLLRRLKKEAARG
jgi:hypothetical protein